MDPKRKERLSKLLNMLGSDNDGERINAAGMIKKMADSDGKSVADFVLGAQPASTVYTASWTDMRTQWEHAYHGRRHQSPPPPPKPEPKTFSGHFRGLLLRLYNVYRNEFPNLIERDRDTIEDLLRRHTDDRTLTGRHKSTIRGILRSYEEGDSLI